MPPLPPRAEPLRAAVLTISDRCARDEATDESGPAIAELLSGYRVPGPGAHGSAQQADSGGADAPGAAFRVTRVPHAVPDDRAAIGRALGKLAPAANRAAAAATDGASAADSGDAYHLVVTTGGTGLAPRDVTPEATLEVCEREARGISHLMMQESLRHTPMAAMSRMAAGTRGRTLIVNLPGATKAASEILPALLPILYHACRVTGGDTEHGGAARAVK